MNLKLYIKILIILVAIITTAGLSWIFINKFKISADSLDGITADGVTATRPNLIKPADKSDKKINPQSLGQLTLAIKMPAEYSNQELTDAFAGRKSKEKVDRTEEIKTKKDQLLKDAVQKRYDEIKQNQSPEEKKILEKTKQEEFIDFRVIFTDTEDNIIDPNIPATVTSASNTENSSRVVLAATTGVASNFIFDSNVSQATKDIFIGYYPKVVDLIGPKASLEPMKVHVEHLGYAAGVADLNEVWIDSGWSNNKEAIIHEMVHVFNLFYSQNDFWQEGLAVATTAMILDYKKIGVSDMTTYFYEGAYGQENLNQFFAPGYSNDEAYKYGSNTIAKLFIAKREMIKNIRTPLVSSYRSGNRPGYEAFLYSFSQAAPYVIEGKKNLDWLAEHYAFITPFHNPYYYVNNYYAPTLIELNKIDDTFWENETYVLELETGIAPNPINTKIEIFDPQNTKLAQCEKILQSGIGALFDSNCSIQFTKWDYEGILKIKLTQNNIAHYQYITFIDGGKINYSNTEDCSITCMYGEKYTRADALNPDKYNLVGTINNTIDRVKLYNLNTGWSGYAPVVNKFYGFKNKEAYEEGRYVLEFQRKNLLGIYSTVEKRYLNKTEGFYSINPVMGTANTCSINSWSMDTVLMPANLIEIGELQTNVIDNRSSYTNSSYGPCLQMLYKNGLPLYRGVKKEIKTYFNNLLPNVQYIFELRVTNGKGYKSQTKTITGPVQ